MISAETCQEEEPAPPKLTTHVCTFSLLPVGHGRHVRRSRGPAHREVAEGRGQVVDAAGCRQAGRRWRRRDDHPSWRTCAGAHLRARGADQGTFRQLGTSTMADTHHCGLRFQTAGQGVGRHGVDQQSSDVVSLRQRQKRTAEDRASGTL